MATVKKKVEKTGLDGEKLTFQLDIWAGQKKVVRQDFKEYRDLRDQCIELSKQGFSNEEIKIKLGL